MSELQLTKWRIELYQWGTGRHAQFTIMATDYDTAYAIGESYMNHMPETRLDLHDGYGERQMHWSIDVESVKESDNEI